MTTKITTVLALAGLLAAGVTVASAAQTDEQREATALQGAKVSLTQAIATAEHMTGGKAFDAGVNLKASQPRIAVETNGPKGVLTVIVDAQSGAVIETHAGTEAD